MRLLRFSLTHCVVLAVRREMALIPNGETRYPFSAGALSDIRYGESASVSGQLQTNHGGFIV
jgi:hypothetical protein